MAKKSAQYQSQRPVKQDVLSLLQDKDSQIADLRTQIDARVARAATLQARLIATLDALDAATATANRDLDEWSHQNTKLLAKLRVARDIARAAEEERDDHKDAVLRLVEKVEVNNDYSQWPHSRLHLFGPLALSSQTTPEDDGDQGFHAERVAQMHLRNSSHASTSSAHHYYPSVIEELSRQLAQERTAHSQLKADADAHIAALHAQVARRELELERLLVEDAHSTSAETVTLSGKGKGKQREASILSRAAAATALDVDEARRKALEAEVRILSEQVERAKAAAFEAERDHKSPSVPRPTRTQVHKSVQTVQTNTSPPLPPSQPVAGPSKLVKSIFDPDPISGPIAEVTRQIEELQTHVDGLEREKDNLLHVVSQDNDQTKGATGKRKDDFAGILLIEEECIRLTHVERTLRAELVTVRAAAQARESDLHARIRFLEEEIERCKRTERPGNEVNFISSHYPRREPSPSRQLSYSVLEPSRFLHPSSSLPSLTHSTLPSTTLSASFPTALLDPSTLPLPNSPSDDESDDRDAPSLSPFSPPRNLYPASANTDLQNETSEMYTGTPWSPPPPHVPGSHRSVPQIEGELGAARRLNDEQEREIREMRRTIEEMRRAILHRDQDTIDAGDNIDTGDTG
ncbi:hypothetical protein BD410DRAFT_788793 [Rickenella mellea]|uniref:Uncharacterized protein n=1 Tax=Rickenella mellea TaxID=50990 RepID=A0A4Y7Q5M0_9AGAM|nr:hypothetical protein BD410DRAFT_788793 [Rickenella mellea]